MAVRGAAIRTLYESKGPREFVRLTLHALGYQSMDGSRYRDRTGLMEMRNPRDSGGREVQRFHPSEYSLRELAEGILGHDWSDKLNPRSLQQAEAFNAVQPLLEAGGSMAGGIQASAFADINAFTAVVTGLLEISLMEGWQNPLFIMSEIMPDENTKMFDGRKVIGVTRLGDVSEPRIPGEPTKRAQIGERWITQPRTVENALACEVTQEAVFLDLTGQVLQEANNVGEWIRWRKEIRQIDCFLGITNTYTYKGVAYNTYISNGYFNNTFSNQLLHWTAIQNALILFRDMLDPDTGLRVLIEPNTLVCNRDILVNAHSIVGNLASGVQYRDAPGSTTEPQQIRQFESPYKGAYDVLESPLIYQRMTDATGLNLTPTQAAQYWYLLEKGKAFKYAQNWPLRVQTAAPNQVDMIDRGVVLFTKADERGIPMVYEPRRVVQSTN